MDDLGLREGVDAAVWPLVAQGRVQALSAMVGGASWARASREARALDPQQLDLGLHLDFTERPLLPGSRQALGALIQQSYAGRLGRAAVRAEIRAQLDAFEHTVGRSPAYVDGHQHVHQLPTIREELLAELASRAGSHTSQRPWLRQTRSAVPLLDMAPSSRALGWRERLKPQVIAALGATALRRLAQREGLLQNRRLLGVYDFNTGAAGYLARLSAWLTWAQDGDLLMCHAGLNQGADAASDPIAAARAVEQQVLASSAWGDLLQARGVQLVPMSRILAAPR
ncbi:MAG: hypothetical protein RJA98_1297 [Pseudomonadota bacterium]